MRLVHYSASPLTAVRSVEQTDQPHFKPRGLWVSAETGNEDGWAEWCLEESFALGRLACLSEIKLAADARILRLASARDIDEFTARRGVAAVPVYRTHRTINWQPVAEEYQGIIIAPYIWERRLTDHAPWYYAWDCASGCIWDAAAIASIHLSEPLEQNEVQR